MKISVVIRSYRISTRGPGWTARSSGRLGPRCVLSSVIELRERGEQLPTTRSPSNSKVLAELSRPNLAIVSRARSCSRNCARFGATIGRAVRTSCSSLARRPNPPIVRVSSSQNSPDSSLPVAAQRALDRAGREGVPAERRLPHIKMRVFDTRQSAIAVVCCRSTRSEPSPARIVTGSDRARAI